MDKVKKQTLRKKKTKNPELYWIVGTMIGMLAILVFTPYVMKQLNTFSYEGLTFTKEKFGEIPVFRYSYVTGIPGEEYQYILYTRLDPRKNDVPVIGNIEYPAKGSTFFVSFDSVALSECKNTLRELSTIAGFLNGNGFKVKSGSPNEEFAVTNNITYVDCEEKPNSAVLLIVEGNVTQIERKDKCYVMSINNCEMLNAVEKFEVQSILDAKERTN